MSDWPSLPPHPNPARLVVQPDVQLAEHALAEAQLTGEVCTFSEFRATLAARFERARSTLQPLVITQRGHSSTVLLGIDVFEKLLREIELLRELRAAEDEIETGQEVAHAMVEVRLRGLLGR